MAEVIGAVAAIFTIVQLVNTTADLVHKVNKSVGSDYRLEALALNVDTEKKTLDAWASNVALNRITLPPDEANKVKIAKARLVDIYEKAQSKLEYYMEYSTLNKTPVRSPKAVLARLRFDARGYEELKDLVALLSSLNHNLQTYIPTTPPPPYQGGSRPSANNADRGHAASISSAATSVLEREGAQVESGPLRDRHTQSTFTGSAPTFDLRNIWSTSLDTMVVIADYDALNRNRLNKLREQLLLWGAGLFEGPLGLDVILRPVPREEESLRKCIASYLVEIALVQEQRLETWCSQTDQSHRNAFQQVRSNARVALTGDLITGLAIEQWLTVLTENQAEESEANSIAHMEEVVRLLFKLLPAIRLARHRQVLLLERTEETVRQEVSLGSQTESQEIQHPRYDERKHGDFPVTSSTANTKSETTSQPLAATNAGLALMSTNIEKARERLEIGPRLRKNLVMLEMYRRDAEADKRLFEEAEGPEFYKVQLKVKDTLAALPAGKMFAEDNSVQQQKAIRAIEQAVSYSERARNAERAMMGIA